MWHIHPTEKWIESVIQDINEKQLDIDKSKFMIAFFSSMDNEFVEYFQQNKKQISSFSGSNFHIFTPLIFDEKVIPDDEWRYMREEFNSLGIPVDNDPTFVFFKIEMNSLQEYEPKFFAGFTCSTFDFFPKKLKNAIDISIGINNTNSLQQKLTEIFLTKNIIPYDNVNKELKYTLTNKLPKYKIFVSHSIVDKPFVKKIIHELSKDKDLNFWIDENEIRAGDDIQKSITDNLKSSDYLFLIISESSTKSKWVNFEIGHFIGAKGFQNVIPIIISKEQNFPEPIDNFLSKLKYLDFSDENNWNNNIQELKRIFSNN